MTNENFYTLLASIFLLVGCIIIAIFTDIYVSLGVVMIGASIRLLVYRDMRYKDSFRNKKQ